MPFLLIAELLGYENYIPSFATASGQDILKGVNNASAAAGNGNIPIPTCLSKLLAIYIYIERERERES